MTEGPLHSGSYTPSQSSTHGSGQLRPRQVSPRHGNHSGSEFIAYQIGITFGASRFDSAACFGHHSVLRVSCVWCSSMARLLGRLGM